MEHTHLCCAQTTRAARQGKKYQGIKIRKGVKLCSLADSTFFGNSDNCIRNFLEMTNSSI